MGHLGANGVQSVIVGTSPAKPIAMVPRQRLVAAGNEGPTEDIGRHGRGVAAFLRSVNRIIRSHLGVDPSGGFAASIRVIPIQINPNATDSKGECQ